MWNSNALRTPRRRRSNLVASQRGWAELYWCEAMWHCPDGRVREEIGSEEEGEGGRTKRRKLVRACCLGTNARLVR
eukprot:7660850-Pyramimonas_sp.AAC.1